MSELPPYPSQPVPPGPGGQPSPAPYAGPWVPPQSPQWGPQWSGQWGPPPGYPPDPLISPDFGGWWQRGFTIAKRCWRQILALQAIVGVLTFTVETVSTAWQSFATRDMDQAAAAGDDPALITLFAGSGLVIVGTVVVMIVSMLATLAAVRIVVEAATGREPDLGAALAAAVGRVGPMFGWGLLAGLLIVAGLCACVVPGLYFAAVLLVLSPVIALERGNGIGRCFKLFHGDFGASLARTATILGIVFGAALAGGAIGLIASLAAPPATASTGAIIAAAAVSSGVSVVLSGAIRLLTDPLTVTAYADMRARIEPLSTAVLAHEAGIR
ncbi:hypothetical protein [Phytohabitans houttuyneae]|uniref:Glycerophosphoryl diester phosphodiesterase membrane domain-containing protein n=1 Tax=Phytohabitans houttuyneae TaxID=1076126 RepID=A0A6V8KB57_9ACTN|nr:hypothetical protein [Phytohabitans houttuyneae]GFJ79618.1 hypothetical protein Phou_037980 [Phytohabitans houttuyneae]